MLFLGGMPECEILILTSLKYDSRSVDLQLSDSKPDLAVRHSMRRSVLAKSIQLAQYYVT